MKTSSARRVYALLKAAHEFPMQRPTLGIVVWAYVLGLEVPNSEVRVDAALEDKVLPLLMDLRDEVAAVERAVQGGEFERPLAPIANTVRQITSIQQLQSDWSHTISNYLRADFLAGWDWASISLTSIEEDFADESISALQNQLKDLEVAASDVELPENLRRFVLKQAKRIREALSRYRVRGSGPLKDAMSAATGDLVQDVEAIREASDEASKTAKGRELGMKFAAVWRRAAALSGDVDKIAKGVHVLTDLYHRLLPLLPPT